MNGFYLPGANNQETYLNIENIISVAKENNVDAIHPGYGFLSENAEFSKRLKEEGITFIGPDDKLSDKWVIKPRRRNSLKELVFQSFLEVSGLLKQLKKQKIAAAEIGFPVLLKAVAGGGGRGLRPCFNNEDLIDSL